MNNLRWLIYAEAFYQLSWVKQDGVEDSQDNRKEFLKINLGHFSNLFLGMPYTDLEREGLDLANLKSNESQLVLQKIAPNFGIKSR